MTSSRITASAILFEPIIEPLHYLAQHSHRLCASLSSYQQDSTANNCYLLLAPVRCEPCRCADSQQNLIFHQCVPLFSRQYALMAHTCLQ